MIDTTIRNELGSTADPEIHEVAIVGVATSNTDDAIFALVIHIGRSSTHPSITDAGVRVRHLPANLAGLPFYVRIKALRLNPGDQLGVFSYVEVEEDAASGHTMIVVIKDVWTDLQ